MANRSSHKTRRRLFTLFVIFAIALAVHIVRDPGRFWAEVRAGFHDAFDPGPSTAADAETSGYPVEA